jgi:hypothetical protein
MSSSPEPINALDEALPLKLPSGIKTHSKIIDTRSAGARQRRRSLLWQSSAFTLGAQSKSVATWLPDPAPI